MTFSRFLIIIFLCQPLAIYAQSGQPTFHHAQHDEHDQEATLQQPGNDIFGTMQEVIRELEDDPNTDWSKVNLEALRQHLLDMRDLTENVKVSTQKPIERGIEITVKPTTKRAASALDRVMDAHPHQLKKESGWEMKVDKNQNTYTLTVTTENSDEVAKIRGLGYIGIMAYGNHHQHHHWMIATGKHPHHTK